MSIIRAIKHRLGLSVTPANNFVLTAEADNGTMKLARESGQDIMTVDAAGKPRFNQLAQLLSGNGYKVLEGGLIIQWGASAVTPGVDTLVIFPIPFTLTVRAVATANAAEAYVSLVVGGLAQNVFRLIDRNGTVNPGNSFSWIAIGI